MGGETVALIVAGGRGTRAAAAGQGPKQYARLGEGSVLSAAVSPFLNHANIDAVSVVIHEDDHASYAAALGPLAAHAKLRTPVVGGPTRQQSVLNGLEALSGQKPCRVLIHDAARPFVRREVIDRVVRALDSSDGALAAVELTDTLKRADEAGFIAETLPRGGLWRAQTPQGFAFEGILAAHRAAAAAGRFDFTDDAAVAEWRQMAVAVVAGDPRNQKITTVEDLQMAEASRGAATQQQSLGPDIRVGQGFDVHRFKAGDHIWLCGVRVPHTHGVDAHSDGDVALHALTDALLGAIADGDIGQHFRNTDPRWKDAASDCFLVDAARRVRECGGRILNVDITVLCEAPKISPHRDAMRRRVAEILNLPVERVALKATTTEMMGFTGRGEGLAAMAVASVLLA